MKDERRLRIVSAGGSDEYVVRSSARTIVSDFFFFFFTEIVATVALGLKQFEREICHSTLYLVQFWQIRPCMRA